MKLAPISCLLAICCLIPSVLAAQLSLGGQPEYLHQTKQPYLGTVQLPKPAVQKALQEDEATGNSRFAIPISVSLDPLQAGQWKTLDSGDQVWWIELEAPDALGLAVYYEDFQLLPGCRLYLFDPAGEGVLGAYSDRNNKPGGRFVTGFIPGQKAVLELFVPRQYERQAFFRIFRVDYAYRDLGTPEKTSGFGTSDPCNVNINCPEAAIAQGVRPGVCRVRMALEEGTAWCSGTLLNNTAEDGTPYVLSGFHCQDGYTPLFDLWRFDFHYEGPACDNPDLEPVYQSIVGCNLRAGRQESDFILVEVSSDIPSWYNVQYNGWDRSAPAPDSAYHVHHPSADIQKFSIDTNSISIHPNSINWNNGVITPANHHFRTILDIGTFQIGSSGGPLFNTAGQVIAQLHGGVPGCSQVLAYFGRFSISWDAGAQPDERLMEWLDPLNTGALQLGAYVPPTPNVGSISGLVETPEGLPVEGVTVYLGGDSDSSLITDATGTFTFSNLPIGGNYSITLEKDYFLVNGVTTFDMALIQKHILGLNLLLDQPYKMVAADINKSSTVTSLDLVYMLKAILNLSDEFPNNTSWRFIPAFFEFSEPDPLAGQIPNGIQVNNLPGD
ncbi:MAG: carboxypeptidase regulatory-like domain-containing protein, partial [Phaeodactylibacter sp.]|nr:carboxypeptidase regulatory-like domain-containing protein [Phaeodactylibacter sp.]